MITITTPSSATVVAGTHISAVPSCTAPFAFAATYAAGHGQAVGLAAASTSALWVQKAAEATQGRANSDSTWAINSKINSKINAKAAAKTGASPQGGRT